VNIDLLSLISIGGFFLDLLGLSIFRSFGIGGGSSSSSSSGFGVPIRASLIS
jgi:hypothetical protein